MYVSEVTLSLQGCILKILLLPPFSQSAELSHNEVCLSYWRDHMWVGGGKVSVKGEKERGLKGATNGDLKDISQFPCVDLILIQTSVCYFYLFQVKCTY